MLGIESRFGTRNYYLSKEQIEKMGINGFKEEAMENAQHSMEKRRDIYSEMPIRALGYTNELGEAIRPISPMLANLSWLPAIGYISADVADKYKQDDYAAKDPSKTRASKQLTTQLLASVFLPTFAVKLGQGLTNSMVMAGKTGLTLNHREKISEMVLDSMKKGEHKDFLLEDGTIDKELYKNSLSEQLDEIIKHKKTHKKQNPFMAVVNFVKKPFIAKPTEENIKKYKDSVVDRLIDDRQKLLNGEKPENMSKRGFKKFSKSTVGVAASEHRSVAFDMVRKMEKSRMFNNRILKSIGGLTALACMAKPIDKFVEHVIINKYVGPQIDNIAEIYRNQKKAKENRA